MSANVHKLADFFFFFLADFWYYFWVFGYIWYYVPTVIEKQFQVT